MALHFRFDDTVAVDDPMRVRYALLAPGTPGPCPECEEAGRVDSADLATRVQNQCCPECGYRWQYRFAPDGRLLELRELPGRRLDLLSPPRQEGVVVDLRTGPEPVEAAPGPASRSWWRR